MSLLAPTVEKSSKELFNPRTMDTKEANNTVSLGTSMVNYMDPRLGRSGFC